VSLNWKEINLVLEELPLEGYQVQKIIQSTFDVLTLQVHGWGQTKTILIAITPGACRIHETFRAVPKTDKPLRFQEFLKSRIVNARIESICQIDHDRIIKIVLKQGQERFYLYVRLWSNAANVILCDDSGNVLDAMRRSPKRGEISGGSYNPEQADVSTNASKQIPEKIYEVRELSGEGTFNSKLDTYYAEEGGALSLEALKEQTKKIFEGRINKVLVSIENLREKKHRYEDAESYRQYGDIIMANISHIKTGESWLEAENFYTEERVRGEYIRIKIDPKKNPAANAEQYYDQYRKAKNGIGDIVSELQTQEDELSRLESVMESLLNETNPLRLHKLLRNKSRQTRNPQSTQQDKKRPGLTFKRKDWLILVGRDASENDALLRKFVKGNDMWLHTRDVPGGYVFIKQKTGKSFPLDILVDAGNLALFYSKGRNAGEGDLFYTPVKYLRRAKNGPKGLVIPTQEKNLHIKLDEKIIKELEYCKIEKK
jgi:predicted ribosome quality control (RQC) complex YloA/Tae2 family protein